MSRNYVRGDENAMCDQAFREDERRMEEYYERQHEEAWAKLNPEEKKAQRAQWQAKQLPRVKPQAKAKPLPQAKAKPTRKGDIELEDGWTLVGKRR